MFPVNFKIIEWYQNKYPGILDKFKLLNVYVDIFMEEVIFNKGCPLLI